MDRFFNQTERGRTVHRFLRVQIVYSIALALSFCAALAQQPTKDKPPMPLATAWQNVNAACSMAMDDLLTGRQSRALKESLVTLQKALMIYEQYTTVK